MTDESRTHEYGDSVAATKHNVHRICIICHAQKLGEPVVPADCLGFVECEDCTKILEYEKNRNCDTVNMNLQV